MRVNNLQSLTNIFFSVILSGTMIAAPAVSMQGCGLAQQRKWISEGKELSAKHARENLKAVFTDLYDYTFSVPKDRHIPLITFDGRRGRDQWGECVPGKAEISMIICAYDIGAEQMAEASDAAFHVSSYYKELLEDKKRNAETIQIIQSRLSPNNTIEQGPFIKERFKQAYIQALEAGIVNPPRVEGPSASR